MRDEFTLDTKEKSAKRVGFRCSNPNCRQPTSGPGSDPQKVINVGVAAHIMAASPGGERYNPEQSSAQRKSIDNCIWLCQNCAKLIDSDAQKYSVELLNKWKKNSEEAALLAIEDPNSQTDRVINVNSEVVSINQSGGQTANTIINKKPRKRSLSHARDMFISELSKIEPIDYDIQVLMNDMEANSLAQEVKEVFHTAGWNKGEIIKGLGGVYHPGIAISRNIPTKQSEVITVLFIKAGLFCAILDELRGSKLQIYIGPNPDAYQNNGPEIQWKKQQF